MSIKINIHKTHRQFTNGLDIVELDGNTVGACLDNCLIKRENWSTLLKFTSI